MSNREAPVISVENLVVDYKLGRGKTWRAVRGISFSIYPGECIGFIGANGAGKSSTMKSLMGFVFPTSGEIQLFGAKAGTVESRKRLGYLPEVAMYYPFMKARELLELYGGLQGLSKSELKTKIPLILEKVGLVGKGEILLKQFSKGMQQRLGIAQAIIADPEVLIFDELSSGLDPMGRHDLRDVILELKQQGKTIFFSSHELSEVESLCDRVIMIDKGLIVSEASVQELMKPLNIFQVSFKFNGDLGLISKFNPINNQNVWEIETKDPNSYSELISLLAGHGAEIISTNTKARSLEDYFISLVTSKHYSTESSEKTL